MGTALDGVSMLLNFFKIFFFYGQFDFGYQFLGVANKAIDQLFHKIRVCINFG